MYRLGAASLAELTGVHPALAAIVTRAICLSAQDFVVAQGVRDAQAQRQLFEAGRSRKLDSKHTTGGAVDLVPVDHLGHLAPEWPLHCRVARAVQIAANQFSCNVRWGGVWDRPLNALYPGDLPGEVAAYTQRAKARYQKRHPDTTAPFSILLFGSHYELL